MNVVYFDIETTTWFDQPELKDLPRDLQISGMKFGCAVATNGEDTNEYLAWDLGGQNHNDHQALWDTLYSSADVVAGWNITSFDLPILAREVSGHLFGYPPQIFDLFEIIKRLTGRWYKLDVVARANLGKGKTADGLQAAKWLAEGGEANIRKALDYCRNDVTLERELGEMARSGKSIILPPLYRADQKTEITLRLDWTGKTYNLQGDF